MNNIKMSGTNQIEVLETKKIDIVKEINLQILFQTGI